MNTSDNNTIERRARLGPSVRFNGELSGKEDLTVKGHIRGKIHLADNNLVIEKDGHVQAEIQAGNIVIRGFVEGNVTASQKVTIEKSGRMTGDITSARIAIEDGAQFKGSITTENNK